MRRSWPALSTLLCLALLTASLITAITTCATVEQAFFEQVEASYAGKTFEVKSGDVLKVHQGGEVTFRIGFKYHIPPPKQAEIKLEMEYDNQTYTLASIAGVAEASLTVYNKTIFSEPGYHRIVFKLIVDEEIYDIRSFTAFVSHIVADLKAEYVELVRGLEKPVNISFTVMNLGNDEMYNVSVQPPKDGSFSFQPISSQTIDILEPKHSHTFIYQAIAKEGAPAGVNAYVVKVSYQNFLGQEFTQSFIAELYVERQNLSIIPLNVSSPSVEVNKTFSLIFLVKDMANNPVKEIPLKLFINNSLVGAAQSKASGVACFKDLKVPSLGSYQVVVSYEGDYYNPAMLNMNLTAIPPKPKPFFPSISPTLIATVAGVAVIAFFIGRKAYRKLRGEELFYY